MTRTKGLAIIIVFLLLSAGFADFKVFVLAGQQQGDTRALCAFRHDIQTRYDAGVQFLLAHPRGIAGVPNATLRLSLTNEQHTLAALGGLQC